MSDGDVVDLRRGEKPQYGDALAPVSVTRGETNWRATGGSARKRVPASQTYAAMIAAHLKGEG